MEDIYNLLSNVAKFLKVIAVDTKDQWAVRPANKITHLIFNRLADTEIDAWYLLQPIM